MLRRPAILIPVLGVIALLAAVAFMTIGAKGSWSFILSFRGTKLAAMVLVAYAIAVSTVLFQTVTNNRILTPSIMGFDALYILIQTVIVFFFGAVHVDWIGPNIRFITETVVMVLFAGSLYYWLFSGAARSLHLVMLVGIICGVFFRSLSNLMQRMLDPDLFAVLQDRFFASFNTINADILTLSAIIVAAVSLYGWRLLHVFDVLALGREPAINLGVDHRRVVRLILLMVTVLVAVSTALVGPITFFGLLVANLAYMLAGSGKHRVVLPIAVLLAIICIVGGQTILERAFAFNTALSVIIEFLGGLVFIILLVRGNAR
ncbi:iron chelate uptake ABC transporter family permease subunit [Brucella haematophila]|uniref:iron chelate uptake ABC transporter family permease subunit n=1 Tax=Brucella TaxID=234 RepID=UPI00110D9D53|nr:iron chelate uptake ABC transporter family permease subunit [Brucella haematophila]KAB2698745.1 iron chelate uptake ABC transporter family permease subunit [Ochrobactrum sp. Kaboul]TMU91604.1 iron chelate uptake ABC transporter family permease subunit [Brucella haematophila]